MEGGLTLVYPFQGARSCDLYSNNMLHTNPGCSSVSQNILLANAWFSWVSWNDWPFLPYAYQAYVIYSMRYFLHPIHMPNVVMHKFISRFGIWKKYLNEIDIKLSIEGALKSGSHLMGIISNHLRPPRGVCEAHLHQTYKSCAIGVCDGNAPVTQNL